MWAIPTGTSWFCFKRKKNQVKSPSIWSRVPETGSDPPIGSDRDSGRDRARLNEGHVKALEPTKLKWLLLPPRELNCELGCKI